VLFASIAQTPLRSAFDDRSVDFLIWTVYIIANLGFARGTFGNVNFW
jgi:hypothetical protein